MKRNVHCSWRISNGNGLGTADKPVSVTKDNVLNFIATALSVNRANMKPIEFPEAFGKRPSASFRD